MKSYIKWSLNFTTSKLLSYLIFLGGFVAGIYLKDKTIIVESMMYSALLQGTKAVSERFKNDK